MATNDISNEQKNETKTEIRLCDYCQDAPAEGYVPSYDAHICEDCYYDHHGP